MKKTTPQQQKLNPKDKWQTGAYTRHANYQFVIPDQFLMLCRLTDTSPQKLLLDFMDNLACACWKRAGRDIAKEHLIQYFIAHGYGQHNYTATEIREMFKEMDAMGMLFPAQGKMKMIDLYSKWRKKQHRYWFKHWYRKSGRKSPKEDE